MALNKFLIFEIVNLSSGGTARVKNYYKSNNNVVLYQYKPPGYPDVWGNMSDIKPGTVVTGQSSGYSKTITEWDYSFVSVPDVNYVNSHVDLTTNHYEWEKDFNNIIVLDAPFIHTIVEDYIYDQYPHDVLTLEEYPAYKYEIIEHQLDESIIQDG